MTSNSNNNTIGSSAKFRPAFTKQEIAYLLDLCRKDTREATATMASNIAARLRIFSLKADLGIVSPAFNSTERQSVEDRLGFDIGNSDGTSSGDSPTAKRLTAFNKWQINAALCTEKELKLAMTHRYDNGLMTPEEENEYESF